MINKIFMAVNKSTNSKELNMKIRWMRNPPYTVFVTFQTQFRCPCQPTAATFPWLHHYVQLTPLYRRYLIVNVAGCANLRMVDWFWRGSYILWQFCRIPIQIYFKIFENYHRNRWISLPATVVSATFLLPQKCVHFWTVTLLTVTVQAAPTKQISHLVNPEWNLFQTMKWKIR